MPKRREPDEQSFFFCGDEAWSALRRLAGPLGTNDDSDPHHFKTCLPRFGIAIRIMRSRGTDQSMILPKQ